MALTNTNLVLICMLSALINVTCGNNVALGKSVWQSSTESNGPAEYGVDDCLNTQFEDFCCTHTGPTLHTWWGVDLGSVYSVYAISLTNRNAHSLYGAQRLRQFSLYGSNMSHDPALATDKTLCADHPEPVVEGTTERIQCELTARFVIVSKTMLPTDPSNDLALTLCEVQVEACDTTLINCAFCAASPNECSECIQGYSLVDGACKYVWQMESQSHVWQHSQVALKDSETLTCIKSDGKSQIQMRLSLDNNPPMNLTLIGRNLGCESHLFVSVGSLTTANSAAGGFVGILKLCTYVAEESVADSLCFFDCAAENNVYESLVIQKYLPTAVLEICEIKLGF